MDAPEIVQCLETRFGTRVACALRSPKRLYVSVAPADLVEVFEWFRSRVPGFRLGTSTVIDLRDGVGVFHHFPVNGKPLVVTLKVLAAKPDPRVPSLAPLIPAAAWIEREMHDILGVVFEGHPDLRRLVKAEAFPDVYPMRRDFHVPTFKESIGERPSF